MLNRSQLSNSFDNSLFTDALSFLDFLLNYKRALFSGYMSNEMTRITKKEFDLEPTISLF